MNLIQNDLGHTEGFRSSVERSDASSLPVASVIIADVTSLTVRVARRGDLPAIEQLVADMFGDVGTVSLPATWVSR